MKHTRVVIRNTLIVLLILFLTTILAQLFVVFDFQEATIVILYLLAVLIITQTTTHHVYGILASVLSVLVFNFFFTEPLYSFNTHQPDYIFTFFVMLASSLFSSTLTSRLKQANTTAEKRAQQLELIDQINQVFTRHASSEVAKDLVTLLERHFHARVVVWLEDEAVGGVFPMDDQEDLRLAMTEELRVNDHRYGMLRVASLTQSSSDTRRFVASLAALIAQNLERQALVKQAVESEIEMREQRLKNNLLSAISHDLRTPLATIQGSAETLAESDALLSSGDRMLLLRTIQDDARWLIDSVENILSIMRVDEHLTLNLEKESVEELFGDVVAHVVGYCKQHIRLALPKENLIYPMDIRLMEKVLINIVNNAINYAPAESIITLSAYTKSDTLVFDVADEGPGIADEFKSRVFNRFMTTTPMGEKRKGLGLGLAICKAIVEAHHGRIFIKDNEPKGTIVRCVFPLEIPHG